MTMLPRDDTENVFDSLGWCDTVLFILLMLGGVLAIGLLTLCGAVGRLVSRALASSFVGPYRRVR